MRDNGAEWKNCKTTTMQNMCHDYLFLEKYIFGTFPKKSLTQVWLVRLFTLFSACESQGEQSSFARNQTRCIVLSRGIKVEVSSSHKWNDAWWCNTGPTTSLQIYPKSTTPLHSSDLGPRLGCLDTWVERRLLDFFILWPLSWGLFRTSMGSKGSSVRHTAAIHLKIGLCLIFSIYDIL